MSDVGTGPSPVSFFPLTLHPSMLSSYSVPGTQFFFVLGPHLSMLRDYSWKAWGTLCESGIETVFPRLATYKANVLSL